MQMNTELKIFLETQPLSKIGVRIGQARSAVAQTEESITAYLVEHNIAIAKVLRDCRTVFDKLSESKDEIAEIRSIFDRLNKPILLQDLRKSTAEPESSNGTENTGDKSIPRLVIPERVYSRIFSNWEQILSELEGDLDVSTLMAFQEFLVMYGVVHSENNPLALPQAKKALHVMFARMLILSQSRAVSDEDGLRRTISELCTYCLQYGELCSILSPHSGEPENTCLPQGLRKAVDLFVSMVGSLCRRASVVSPTSPTDSSASGGSFDVALFSEAMDMFCVSLSSGAGELGTLPVSPLKNGEICQFLAVVDAGLFSALRLSLFADVLREYSHQVVRCSVDSSMRSFQAIPTEELVRRAMELRQALSPGECELHDAATSVIEDVLLACGDGSFREVRRTLSTMSSPRGSGGSEQDENDGSGERAASELLLSVLVPAVTKVSCSRLGSRIGGRAIPALPTYGVERGDVLSALTLEQKQESFTDRESKADWLFFSASVKGSELPNSATPLAEADAFSVEQELEALHNDFSFFPATESCISAAAPMVFEELKNRLRESWTSVGIPSLCGQLAYIVTLQNSPSCRAGLNGVRDQIITQLSSRLDEAGKASDSGGLGQEIRMSPRLRAVLAWVALKSGVPDSEFQEALSGLGLGQSDS